jgi:hypothetical protein
MAELAVEVSRQSGKPVAYQDLPAEEYAKALVGFGLPEPFAEILADSDVRHRPGGPDHRQRRPAPPDRPAQHQPGRCGRHRPEGLTHRPATPLGGLGGDPVP